MGDEVFDCEVLVPGLADGSLCFADIAASPSAKAEPSDVREPVTEIERFAGEIDTLAMELKAWVDRLAARGMAVEADVVRTHVEILNDKPLRSQIVDYINSQRCSAEHAVEAIMEQMAVSLAASPDSCLSERATDVRDLAAQLAARLDREQWERLPRLLEGVQDPILAVRELYPSIVLKAAGLNIRAFVVERGTDVSHGAILAKALGLPVVKAEPLARLRQMHGRSVRVDGQNGQVIFASGGNGRAARQRYVASKTRRRRAENIRPPTVPAELFVNIIDPSQLSQFDWSGVRGVGLYRTETLFVQRHDDFPSEQQQYETYRLLFDICGDRPITIRTADIGGDKAVSYLSIGAEPNPYLGLRGPRLYRFHPDLVTAQLRAILRAAAGRDGLRILYPMVNSIEDWQDIEVLYNEAADSLRREGQPVPDKVRQGVLIETPAAALSFSRFLEQVDFASVGTNDLVQYLFAVDRNNANVAHLYQPEHPIVLGVLADLVSRARAADKPLSICGEIAGQLRFVPLLIGLGFTQLSVSPPSIEAVRRRLSRLRLADCQALARDCLAADSADAVRTLLGRGWDRGPSPAGRRIDPVCGMAVRTQGNPFTIWYEGVRYCFCSRRCLLKFSESRQPSAGLKKA